LFSWSSVHKYGAKADLIEGTRSIYVADVLYARPIDALLDLEAVLRFDHLHRFDVVGLFAELLPSLVKSFSRQ
jgi:hypothetical protein